MPPFARDTRRPRASRASSLSNKAKQVAPLPDMRTKLAPGCAEARRARRRSAAPARSPALRGRCAPRASRRAARDRRRPSARTPPRSTAATRGLTSSTGVPDRSGEVDRRRARRPPLRRAPAGSAGRPARRCRASARPPRACVGSIRHNRVSSRSAAAASAEPPPIPDATGSFLSSVMRGARRSRRPPRRSARAARGPDCRRRSPRSAANGPVDRRATDRPPSSALSRSPSVQKAKTVSIAWRPSGSCRGRGARG